MSKRKIALWAGISLMIIWIGACAYTITCSNINSLHQFLYISRNKIKASKLFLFFILRHSIFLLSFMFGICFLAMYYISNMSKSGFAKCTILLFISSGLTETTWNLNTYFYATNKTRNFWLHSYNSLLVLFASCLFIIVLPWFPIKTSIKKLLRNIMLILTFLAVFLIWAFSPKNNYMILYFFAGIMLLLIAVLFVLQFFNKPFSRVFFELLLVPPFLFLVLHAVFISNMRALLLTTYNNYSAGIITSYSIIISLYQLTRERSSLLFRRFQNRTFEEAMYIKTHITNLLVEYCKEPAHQIQSMAQLALNHGNSLLSDDQRRILYRIQDASNILNWHLRNIQEYETLPSTTLEMEKIRVKLGTLYSYIVKEFSSPLVVLDWKEAWENLNVLGEPYALIRANVQYCSAILPLGAGEPVHIACYPDDNYIRIEFSLRISEENYRKAKRIRNIMNKGSVFRWIEDVGNMPLFVAHSIFSRHGCPPKVEIFSNGNGFTMVSQYHVQSWDSSMDDALDNTMALYNENCTDEQQDKKVILLLSNSPEEIDLISSYLAFEPYRLRVFTSESNLLQNLSNIKNLSVLIIGCSFLDHSIYSLCWMVREHFSLGQLPILLVQRDPELKTHTAARSFVNGIVMTPSDHFEFCQKVKTLVELQDSVKSTILSRLAFLQAQINPHFIFNTINTIMALCLDEPMNAYNLMGFFAYYLRNSLFSRDLDKPYPVYQELDLIQAYLSIEKARFKDQLAFEVESNVSDTTLILPMLVEPLVENSVKHGMRGKSQLKVEVSIEEENDFLHVIVRDNGAGFRQEKLLKVETKALPNNRSIGLENVRTRLKLFYKVPLNIESTPNEGTCVSFSLKLNCCTNRF